MALWLASAGADGISVTCVTVPKNTTSPGSKCGHVPGGACEQAQAQDAAGEARASVKAMSRLRIIGNIVAARAEKIEGGVQIFRNMQSGQ